MHPLLEFDEIMPVNTLDVGSKNSYPGRELSNFAANTFTIDEVTCKSMESFLQSLKYDKPHLQLEICKLSAIAAKKKGSERNHHWKIPQCLWWKGEIFDRSSDNYQRLLDKAYIELAKQSEKFRKALEDSGDLILTHLIGHSKAHETILTQDEFCDRLMKLRKLLRKGVDLNTLSRL